MRYLCLVMMLFVVMMVCSCGVETGSGSGNGSENQFTQVFSARFVDGNAQGVSGVRMSLDLSGAECLSDSSGNCSFETDPVSGDLDLLIVSPGQDGVTLRINGVPAEAQAVDFEARLEGAQATLVTLAFDGTEVPVANETPAPSNTPSSGATPTPTRKPGVVATPTPAPTPDPVSRGRKVFQRTCGQCHSVGKGDGQSLDQLTQTLQLSQHRALRFSSDQMNDLVAFLNR